MSAPTRAKAALPKTLPPPTYEEIALCAYFISHEKRSLGLPSDPAQDWIEAESRLASERKGGKRARSSENRSE